MFSQIHLKQINFFTKASKLCWETLNYGKDKVSAMGSIDSKAQKISYLLIVSWWLAKTGKPYSIWENIFLPSVRNE